MFAPRLSARLLPAALAAALVLVATPAARAGGKPQPRDSVRLAKTWDAAVEEAKLRNVPLVVHSHGFYCPPCWGLHGALMCNKKYMEFASENTVEVISMSRLDEGVKAEDRKAETYEAKENGEKVEYLVEFPGLTVQDVIALHASKASSYNTTGKTPYTCLVDPFTLEKLTDWQGGAASSGAVMEGVEEAKKALQKEHGKGIAGKDWRALVEAEKASAGKLDAKDYAAALDPLAKLETRAAKWPEGAQERVKAAKERVVAAATAALDALEQVKAEDPSKAKKELAAMSSRLRGTGLETRAKELLGTL